MGVPTARTDLSSVAASNSPGGAETVAVGTGPDDYLRAHASLIRMNYDDIVTLGTSVARYGHVVENYGAVGNGSTDDTVAIQAAIDAALAVTNGSNTVILGPKVYKTTAPLYINLSGSKSIRFLGSGHKIRKDGTASDRSGTVLSCAFASTGRAIQIYNTATTIGTESARCYFELADFGMQLVSGTGVTGLAIGDSGAQIDGNAHSVVRNVSVSGFDGNQLLVYSARALRFENCSFIALGSGSTAVTANLENNSSSRFAGDMVFDGCQFVGSGTPNHSNVVVSGNNGGEVRGIHFTDCNFYYGQHSLYLLAQSGGKVEDIFVDSCAVDGAGNIDNDTDYGINLYATGANSVITGINISNSYIVNWDLYGIVCGQASSGVVTSVNVTGNYIGMCESNGIRFNGTEGFVASNNTLFDCGTNGASGSAIVVTGATAGLFSITGNVHRNTTSTRTASWVVAVSELSAGDIHEFTVMGNVGHCDTAAVLDNTTTSNKTVSGNWRRA